jgi:2-polyprenyl-3-methyl-5-hydroxy-6-metoxy-1,4-benzoquinol methylase
MTHNVIQSPLVERSSAKLIETLSTHAIIREYANSYQLDVSEYFAGLDKVLIYECQNSSYRFYYPFTLAGRETLYQHLQQFDWNYKATKWEYEKAIQHLPTGSRVLDVGSGSGAFVKLAGRAGLIAHGLELNSAAAKIARDEGLSVSTEMIGDHAKRFPLTYDAVCSFQVLEHIPNVRQFIGDCISLLRPGGVLIYGVPNNDSFIRLDRRAVLNVPPHHMGLWTKKSLSAIATIFPVNLRAIFVEPLIEVDWYVSVMEHRYIPTHFLRSIYYSLGASRLYRRYVTARREKIPGHTILAMYEKS